VGHALPLLIRRFRCRLNLQTAFLTRPPFTGAGRAWKYPYRHCRYTVTLKPAIPAQAGI
ncbi:hypothetical protein FA879_002090, partial [Neisseria gonorrhoeae]